MTQRFCRQCGTAITPEARFCRQCGTATRLAPMPNKAASEARFTEADNVGTRLETAEKATAHWLASLAAHSKGVNTNGGGLHIKGATSPPFVAYTFKDRATAENAITSLSYIKRTGDTGNLISTELINFGYYEDPPGVFEVLIFGESLTQKMYDETMKKLAASGGKLKDHREPPQKIARNSAAPAAVPVAFVRTEKKGQFTYHIYRGPGKESALACLKTLSLPKKFEYHIVETPEGNFGRDVTGMFEE